MIVRLEFGAHTSFGFGVGFCWPSTNAPMAYESALASLLPPIFTGTGGTGLNTFCAWLSRGRFQTDRRTIGRWPQGRP
jgi:hypothetical protein